jgi:hypothetical protein
MKIPEIIILKAGEIKVWYYPVKVEGLYIVD